MSPFAARVLIDVDLGIHSVGALYQFFTESYPLTFEQFKQRVEQACREGHLRPVSEAHDEPRYIEYEGLRYSSVMRAA